MQEFIGFIIKTAGFFVGAIVFAAYLSLIERKFIGRIQMRLGPTRCGIFGVWQPIADALKLFFKRNALKGHSAQSIFAVFLLFFIALMQLSIIPLSKNFLILNPSNGLLFIIFFHTLFVVAEILIGTTSASKYGVIGGIRSYLQLVGGHIVFVLSLICVFLYSGSLNLLDIVKSQEHHLFALLLLPVFVVFFISSLASMNRTPFDFTEAESEIVAGAYVEYGGILFAMIYLSDYLNIIFMSAVISILFLGGYKPIFDINFVPPCVWLVLKILIITCLTILIRAMLPRYRQDQMIEIFWIIACPIIIGYLLFLI